MSYAQNIDFRADEYGHGVLVPGPALVTITDNAELTGVPFLRQAYIDVTNSDDHIYFAEGLLGATNIIRRVKTVVADSTPVIDTTGSITVAHTGHSTVQIDDMVLRVRVATLTADVYIVGADASDTWVQKFDAASATPSANLVTVLTTSGTNFEHKIISASDGNIYVGHRELIDRISAADAYSAAVLNINMGWGVTAMAEWNNFLVIAANNTNPFTFAERKSAGNARIIVWDMVSSNFEKIVECPTRYISALVNDPAGNLYAFGGLSEGRTTVYEFTGYGFTVLTSYIGDMPRSRHSVDFDGQGRLNWLTADGQWLRFTKGTASPEHLGTITTASSAGGIFTRLLGGSGNEFLASSGSGSTYTMKRVTFGGYLGDGAGADGVTTPLAISGMQFLPPKSTITAITLHLTKDLATSEKVTLRIYKNGSTTSSDYMDMAYSADGAVSSKRKGIPVRDVNNFALGVAWKQTDALATAPPVAFAEVEYDSNL